MDFSDLLSPLCIQLLSGFVVNQVFGLDFGKFFYKLTGFFYRAEDSTCEHIDVPLLIPISDPRPWRGAHNYPEFPISLEQREFIYGTGRHEPMHLDWRFIVHPFPTWFESSDDHSRPVLVIDNPAYNPDTR